MNLSDHCSDEVRYRTKRFIAKVLISPKFRVCFRQYHARTTREGVMSRGIWISGVAKMFCKEKKH